PEYGQPFSSSNGEDWTHPNIDLPDGFSWIDGTFGEGTFVLLGAGIDPLVAVSNDGYNWEMRAPYSWDSPEIGIIRRPAGVSYANGHFYITTQARPDTPLWRSVDGVSWEAVPFASTISNLNMIWGLTYLADRYYLYGERNN